MKRVSFKKKKFVVAMLVLSIPVSVMTGCGKASVKDKVVDIVEDAVPAASALVSSELYTNEYAEYVNEIQSKYDFEDVYTTDEFLSLLNTEIENCYQKDLEVNKDATLPKRIYSKTDDMQGSATMTFILVKGLCEEVNPIDSTASFFYDSFDEYYLEITKESAGFLQCECYVKMRSSE